MVKDSLNRNIWQDSLVVNGTFIRHSHSPPLVNSFNHMQNRIGALNLAKSEMFHVKKYRPGGHYAPHLDYLVVMPPGEDHLGNRIATLMLILKPAELGGGTVFPNAGVHFRPAAGDALLWMNMNPDYSVAQGSFHGACPVLAGTKIGVTMWIRSAGQELRMPCPLKQEEHFDTRLFTHFEWRPKTFWAYSDEQKATSPPGPPVYAQLSAGVVRGYVSYAAGRDKPVNVFKGIPFVEPPLKDLRFAKPKRKAAWNGTWDATEYSAACLSNITLHNWQKWIDEDCLYVNVFAGKRCKKDKLCPVLFYIHGGAFTFDSAVMFNDSQIIRKYASDDIVYVITAYRLGIFGLLDLGGDEVVPRNLALHDMLSALRWAQEELAAFGGDAKRITVFGNSAGGTAIEMLNVSPAVPSDLYQQAFVSSGDAFFAENVNAAASRGAMQIVGCILGPGSREHISPNDRRLDCLRRVDALDLLRAQSELEVGPGITLSGPETDTELLPASMFSEILPKWKPRNVMFTVMLDEFPNSGQNITKECANHMSEFGYTSKAALAKCVKKYSNRTGRPRLADYEVCQPLRERPEIVLS
ncbi:Protein C01B10.10 [Aphelenchoides avenae]|nr:Protein C01B10.10 [Aphelenchus avenae]